MFSSSFLGSTSKPYYQLLKLRITLLLLRDLYLSNLGACSLRMETSQLICLADWLTGVYEMGTMAS